MIEVVTYALGAYFVWAIFPVTVGLLAAIFIPFGSGRAAAGRRRFEEGCERRGASMSAKNLLC